MLLELRSRSICLSTGTGNIMYTCSAVTTNILPGGDVKGVGEDDRKAVSESKLRLMVYLNCN